MRIELPQKTVATRLRNYCSWNDERSFQRKLLSSTHFHSIHLIPRFLRSAYDLWEDQVLIRLGSPPEVLNVTAVTVLIR